MIGGRDGIDGCIAKSEFQVAPLMADTFTHEFINKNKHDTIIKYAYHPASSILLTPKVTTDGGLIPSAKATFVSSSITAYGDGYVAAGSFYFHAMTKAVNLYFHYVKSTTKVSECSFSGFFDFKPTKDYGMVKSSHVGFNSSVDVNMNLIFALNP